MDAQELRNLQEAYMEVVENQQLDESFADRIDKQVKKNKEYAKKRKPVDVSSFADRIDKQVEQRKKEKDRINEEVDIYDIILSHLLDEGYAETREAAEKIMVHMSEEWRESIVEDIAARAAKVVDDQRQGYLGDADAIRKNQDALSKSMGRLKRGQGPVVTPGLPGV